MNQNYLSEPLLCRENRNFPQNLIEILTLEAFIPPKNRLRLKN